MNWESWEEAKNSRIAVVNGGPDVDEGLWLSGFEVGDGHLLLNRLAHLGKTDSELGLEKLSDAADTTVAKVVDIIGLAKAIHDIAEIGEAGDHVADGDMGDAIEVEVGTDDVDDLVGLFVMGINLNDVDVAVII